MSDIPSRLAAALGDRYAIERKLGEGGMATVYLAADRKHDRKVALKVLKPELAAVVGAERFLGEIKTTANLQHPHILPLFDSGQADGLLWYAMPYVPGESLRDRLDRERQLPLDEAVAIATKVLGALDAAHAAGIVHRDMKPANILIDARGEPLVADFGIALAVQEAGGGRLTETGLSLGTPYYMSPEQATGDTDADARSDVYGMGCVLYEMLVGEPPHTGASAQAVLARILTETAPPVERGRPTVPSHVAAAVQRALEKLPADRFQDAGSFARALADPSFRHGGDERRSAASGSGPGSVALGAVVAVAVVALGVAIWALTRGQNGPAPRVYDVALPDSAAMFFSGQTPATPYGTPFRNLSVSPDGAFVVYLAQAGESTALWQRSLLDTTLIRVPGTEGASMPRVSADGTRLAFLADRSLRVAPLAGGPPRQLVGYEGQATTLEWIAPTRLVLLDDSGNRFREIDTESGEVDRRAIPRCVGGSWIPEVEELVCGLEGVGRVVDPRTGELRELRSGDEAGDALAGSSFRVVDGEFLLYHAPEGDLRVARYDAGEARVGRSATLLQGIRLGNIGSAQYDLTATGTLVYAPGSNANVGRLVRIGPGEGPRPLPVEPATYHRWDLSRDGRRLAVVRQTPGVQELRVHDLASGQSFTWLRAPAVGQPLWMPDGSRLLVSLTNDTVRTLVMGSPESSAPPDTLARGVQASGSAAAEVPSLRDVVDADLVLGVSGGTGPAVAFDPGRTPLRFDTLAGLTSFAAGSPDGRHLLRSPSDGYRVVLSALPPSGWERPIAERAAEPLWLSDSEILYRSGVTWYVVEIDPASGTVVSPPRRWASDPRFSDTFGWSNRPSHDGGIVYLQGPPDTDSEFLRVIPQWTDEMAAALEAVGG